MKSLCIKTNHFYIIDYLLKNFENIKLENTYVSVKKFKHFHNIIIHYRGKDSILFYNKLSNIIAKLIIHHYENELIYSNINLNYFYFNNYEKKKIYENTIHLLSEPPTYHLRYDYIINEIYEYITSSHSLYLQAFINFKFKKYINFLNEQIDIAVNKFIIDKEYIEFVNILKLYIKSESENSQIKHLHLIYKNKTSIIVDDQKNIISCNDNIKKAKYVSDISFSSNDFALNTLLNLIPKSITLHLVDGFCDEFINTLKLIFQERIKICEDCDICNIYRHKEITQKNK